MLFYASLLEAGVPEIRSLYQIEEGCLIARDGKVYPRIAFLDSLHEGLAWELKDPELALAMARAFQDEVLLTLAEGEEQVFSSALLKVCSILVPNLEASERALCRTLRDLSFDVQRWQARHPNALADFLKRAFQHHITVSSRREVGPTRIVLLTTTAAGGNLSVAKALRDFLGSYPEDFEVFVLDHEAYVIGHDPIWHATGGYTRDNIYRVLQQEDQIPSQLLAKESMCYEASCYIPDTSYTSMKEAVAALQPHLVISTRNYDSDDFNLLSLGVPFALFNCDHEICPVHEPYLGKVDPERVQFWVPNASPHFFRKLFLHRGREDLYDEGDSWGVLLQKLATVLECPVDELQRSVHAVGFPVRLEFELEQDPSKVSEIRKRWGVEEAEQALLVEVGANGAGVLEEVFEELLAGWPAQPSLHCFFICGRNEAMQKRLQLRLSSLENAEKLGRYCHVLGWIEAEEKSDLMTICDLMLGKPGGSSQAELQAMCMPLLVVHLHRLWEQGNKEELERVGLSYDRDPSQPLWEQVQQILKSHDREVGQDAGLGWKERFLTQIQQLGR
jgi:hypothetical protein